MQNIPVIPKSASKNRIIENLASLEFIISPEHMELLDKLDCNYRNNKWGWASHHPEYPFNIPF